MIGRTPAELELLRLARLLGVEPSAVDDLAVVPLEDLRALRDQIAGRLFDEGREAFERAASVANIVPAALAAKLAQHALGPVLAARTTAVTDPAKAVDLASRFPASFLADVAVELDPRVVDALVSELPPAVIADVGRELASRAEWLVMADFVGTISDAALEATMHALTDESILQVAQLMADPTRLDAVVALLDDERIASLVATARDAGLEAELDVLREGLGATQRARVPG